MNDKFKAVVIYKLFGQLSQIDEMYVKGCNSKEEAISFAEKLCKDYIILTGDIDKEIRTFEAN